MAEPLLHVQGLRKRYGALLAVDDVSFDLAGGECHALIGPNGAGKTTLVHLISGLVRPDEGTISFTGRDFTRLPAAKRAQLGLVRTFQITSVINSFTTLDNVAFAAQARHGSSFRFLARANRETALNEAAMAALAEVGLDHRAPVPAATLAHGEKRILELAMALVQQPRALLLDEPMAGVGLEDAERLLGLLDRLKARLPMLLIEHDMHAVFSLADRLSVLVYGRLIATGQPAVVRADPEVRAAYLGDAA